MRLNLSVKISILLLATSSIYYCNGKLKTYNKNVTTTSFLSPCELIAGNTIICGDLTVKGKATGEFNGIGAKGPVGKVNFGNVVRVDKIFGNDSTGERNGQPFLTIGAALLATQHGDMVWIFPGEYDESITIPDHISVTGTQEGIVILRQLNVTSDTDLVTMGEYSSLNNISLQLTSENHYQLRGIVLPGKTSETSNVRNIQLTIDNSTASTLGSSSVYGILSNGSGGPASDDQFMFDSSIEINSAGLGSKRGILVNTANGLVVRNTDIIVTNAGGAGSYIGAETSNANAYLELSFCNISGASTDISQTTGSITIGNTDLINSNANGFGFKLTSYPSNIVWADIDGLPLGTKYMKPGTATPSTTEIFIRLSQKMIVKAISVLSRITPSATDTFTVRKNGIDTPLTVSLTNPATFNKNEAVSVSFSESDSISLKSVRGAAGIQDPIVIIDIY